MNAETIVDPPRSHSPVDADIAILGAGFSGSLLAIHLSRPGDGPSVVLIDKSRSHGAGLAYGAAGAQHLLNVPAGRMSAYPDKPDHFLEWMRLHPEDLEEFGVTEVDARAFLPRRLYGRYLTWLVTGWVRDSQRLRLVDANVRDLIRTASDTWRVELENGQTLEVNTVVLATGNFPSTQPLGLDPGLLRNNVFLPSPWALRPEDWQVKAGDILVLGTGLTALDLLVTLRQSRFSGCIHLLSRRGLLPQPHAPVPPHSPQFSWQPLSPTVRGMLRRIRSEVRRAASVGVDWRAVVDSLRADTAAIWRSWNRTERRRFLRHARPWWEVVRHRTAPQIFAVVESLQAEGRLQIYSGRLQRLEQDGDSAVAVFRPRHQGPEQHLKVSTVVNCTGPESDLRRVNDPLIRSMISQGLIQPDPLGLGLEVAPDGAVLDVSGSHTPAMFALGGLRKGLLWESTAVPELRMQAATLASLLLSHWTPSPLRPAPRPPAAAAASPELIWAYEI